MANGNDKSFGQDLVDGLKPQIKIPQIGALYQDTLSNIGRNFTDFIRDNFGITELETVIITPHMVSYKDNTAECDELNIIACFDTSAQGQSQNVFFRGKGSGNANKGSNGRINMTQFVGAGVGSAGQYGYSQQFEQVMGPFCKTNEKGNPILALKSVQSLPSKVAVLELDWRAVMSLILGITSNDCYDFLIYSVSSTKNDSLITLIKFISGNQNRKGKHSGVNYSRLASDLFQRMNGGRGNGENNQQGGRQY